MGETLTTADVAEDVKRLMHMADSLTDELSELADELSDDSKAVYETPKSQAALDQVLGHRAICAKTCRECQGGEWCDEYKQLIQVLLDELDQRDVR